MVRLLKTLSVVLVVGFSSLLASPVVRAGSVPLITGPQDVSQLNATLNGIINNINAVLVPLSGPTNPNATGGILIGGGTASQSPTISTYSTTGATSVSLKLEPLGNGKIILFASNISPMSQGLLKIANTPSWVASKSLVACPGMPSGQRPMTFAGYGSDHITGYLMIYDWLDQVHAVPSC